MNLGTHLRLGTVGVEVPAMALDFVSGAPLDNLITFSRGSNATLTGSNGLIQYAPNNLLTFSEQFNNAAWTKLANGTGVAPVVTANAGTAPDGSATADRVQFSLGGGSTASDWSSIYQFLTIANATNYTYSVWLRSNDSSTYTVLARDDSGSSAVSALWTVTPTWQRFSYTALSTSTASSGLRLWLRGTLGTSATADVLAWGAQLELGSTATTYNSTTVKNLLGFSEAFDNAAWTKGGASIVTGAQANPVNGLFNAQKLMEDTSTSTHLVLPTSFPAVTSGQQYTFSVYAKAAGRTRVYLRDNATSNVGATFDLSAGTVASTEASVISASVINVGSGWYRCGVTYAAGAASANAQVRLVSTGTTTSYAGDGNSGVYIYGAQLSDSASLDPYVPTPAAAPTSTAYYGPRFDYDPVTLAPKGLLIEEARTNLCVYSQTPSDANWSATSAAKTSTNNIDPFGTLTALLLTADGLSGTHYVSTGTVSGASYTSGTTYTISCFVKAGTTNLVQLTAAGATFGSVQYANFSLTGAGSVTASAVGTATIAAYSNGWYRVSLTVPATVTATASAGNLVFITSGTDGRVPTNTSSDTLYVAGWQTEAGSFATSYIPTVAATVTRAADVATMTGTNFSSWYNQSEGTFVVPYDMLWTGAASATYGVLGMDSSGSKRVVQMQGGWTTPSVRDASSNLPTANSVIAGVNKAASGYDATIKCIVLNGGAVASDAVAAGYSASSSLNIGSIGSGSPLNGHIRQIAYYNTRLPNSVLQRLTS